MYIVLCYLLFVMLFYVGFVCVDMLLDLIYLVILKVYVSISNIKGEVIVIVWDCNEVYVGGSFGDGVWLLVIIGLDGDLEIKVQV